MELTPAFFISLAVLLISIGGLVWGLSSKIGRMVSERDLYDLERRLTGRIEERERHSVQSHMGFATRADLESLEKDMKDELKSFRGEVREHLKTLETQHETLLRAIFGLSKQITTRTGNHTARDAHEETLLHFQVKHGPEE